MVEKLCLKLGEDSQGLEVCRREIRSKIGKLCPVLAEGEDIVAYVVFLVNKARKSRTEMRQSLEALFEGKTEEMTDWLWTELRDTLPKPRKIHKEEVIIEPEEPEKPLETPEKRRRCRYWPNCQKEDCPFFHPSEKCPHFPSCKFGSKCIMIHPDCKFGVKCLNPACPFTHRTEAKQQRRGTELRD